MPRYNRRGTSRRSGRGNSALPLIVLLVVAVLLLLVMSSGKSILAYLPPLPNVTIPITGLPQVQIPTVQIPITLVPGTLLPGIGIGGTAVPGTPVPSNALGQRTRTTGCQVNGPMPDGACTPGAVLNVTTNEVCKSGYAGSVRNVPTSVKDKVYAEYGINSRSPGQYEVDHLVSLELGGSNDIANLWPEPASPTPGFHEKDKVENYLHDQVCSGKMSLADAQRLIASNWISVYNQMPK